MVPKKDLFIAGIPLGLMISEAEEYKNNICYSWSKPSGDQNLHEGICFLENDLSGATAVRNHLEKKCSSLAIPERAAFEITLICDELVSNAIVVTHEMFNFSNVLFRWRLNNSTFCFCIIDHGGGFDIPRAMSLVPKANSFTDFIEQLKEYRKNSTVKIKNHGRDVEHTRFGRGLKIVKGLVASLKVTYHDSDGKTRDSLSENVVGSIITATYNINSQ